VIEPDLQRYIDFFEDLREDRLDQLSDVMTDDVHFVDPFNDVIGLEKVRLIFKHMFRDLESPKFNVTHAASVPGSGRAGLLRWELSAIPKRGRGREPLRITGMSEVHLAADGRIHEHIDHWDAGRQFYERIPLLGWLLKRVRAPLKV
jgi:steroid delta-isomerase